MINDYAMDAIRYSLPKTLTIPVVPGKPTEECCDSCGTDTGLRQHERRDGILMVLCAEFRSCNRRAEGKS